jgi:pimeloyl-ACP methyl ester carboxylesterase
VPAGFLGKKKGDLFLTGMPNPETLPSWLTEEDVDYYASEFKRTGFRGGLNRYRNMDRDWHKLPQLEGAKVTQPALFIGGSKDGVLAFTSLEPMKANCSDLRGLIMIEGAGHWTQQERPKETNDAIIAFLRTLG